MAEEKIIPLEDYLLVGADTPVADERYIIATNTDSVENRGVVKGVGDKVNTDKESVQIGIGDKVIYIPGNGIKVTNSDDSDILISVRNIIGIVK